MAAHMSRSLQRAMKKDASRIARSFASSCYDYRRDGRLVRVTDPRAIRVLARAFEHVLINGGKPWAVIISDADAAAFPRFPELPTGYIHCFVAGFDAEGRGTYSVRSPLTRGADTDMCRQIALGAALAEMLHVRRVHAQSPAVKRSYRPPSCFATKGQRSFLDL
ncbi:hypothetical protein [Aliiruegeria lutimaris]|uniref:Uncharacterized protein n=1 Tax=Aliiruegeria lutimaris TaxID=571298 RepID=A0A1G9B691_9RHOB|nr:hypothetical protein [Aliiruegeria lutimaris]SDK35027.1 hypothetical protein SAMN04488026_103840 [Aliiruegeria lutimaris]